MKATAVEHRPRTPGLLRTGLLPLAIVAAQAIAVAVNPSAPWSQGIDDAWREMIGVGPDSGAYTWFLPMLFQALGQLPGAIALMLLLPIGLIIVGRWRSALFVLAVQLAAPGLVSQLLKNTVNRPRPAANGAEGLFAPLLQVDHGSFPSGHSVSAGALAVILLALLPLSRRWVKVAVIGVDGVLIVGMILQRTLINAHWLTDCLVGVCAGAGVALVLWWAFQPLLRHDRDRVRHRGRSTMAPMPAT